MAAAAPPNDVFTNDAFPTQNEVLTNDVAQTSPVPSTTLLAPHTHNNGAVASSHDSPQGAPALEVCVRGLSFAYQFNEEDVRKVFSRYGEVLSVDVGADRNRGSVGIVFLGSSPGREEDGYMGAVCMVAISDMCYGNAFCYGK